MWLLVSALRRLDSRILGERGIAVVAGLLALLLLGQTVGALLDRQWLGAVISAVLAAWAGYGAVRRVRSVRSRSAKVPIMDR